MEQHPALIDTASVQRETFFHIHYMKEMRDNLAAFDADEQKAARLAAAQCKVCYYVRDARIGGSAMTRRPCGICGKEEWYGNTCTDKLCLKCAIEHKICKHCGADQELKPRRKLDLPPKAG